MFFRFILRIQFLLKSTNQHGIHSPFVYNLVTKCFYTTCKNHPELISFLKKGNSKHLPFGSKTAKLINRLPKFLNFKNILVLDDEYDRAIHQLFSSNNNISISTNPSSITTFDLIFINANQYAVEQIKTLFSATHNDSLLLISQIHKTKNNHKTWQAIKENTFVTVTIDSYNLGFVFFRKEQVKEDFIVRL